MENKKLVQLPRYKLNMPKHEAICAMTAYINEHITEFTDGEEITLRYLDNDGVSQCSINAIVDIGKNYNNETVASLSVEIGEYDTLKIVESETEPVDKSSLWLTEKESTGETSDLKSEFKALKLQLAAMQEMVRKHDYALSNTIAGGDIIINSEKYKEENEYAKEQPEDSIFIPSYDTGNTVVDTWDLYIGNSRLEDLIDDENYDFYRFVKYYLKLRLFNDEGKEIAEDSSVTLGLSCISLVAGVDAKNRVLYASDKGTAALKASLYQYNELISTKHYAIEFKKNQKPDYETYGEPNVHHMLIKTASSIDVLEANSDYLCINELCWCIGDSSLYLKAKSPTGTIGLYKINGGGSITPTGETTEITYAVDEEGYVVITDESKKYAFVDAESIINILAGSVDEEGYIVLNDTAPNN